MFKDYSRRIIVSLLCLCFAAEIVHAQGDCPSIVQQALDATKESCDSLGRNQACYGNINLEATPRDGVPDFTFETPGDLVDVANLQSLQLSSLDTDFNSWGVALMKVQANLPDTLPGQNVTFVLFGDVQIENKGGDSNSLPSVNVTASKSVNVRAGASTQNRVVSSLASGDTVSADGRNTAGDWLHVQLDDFKTGWVFANLVTVDGDTSTLKEMDGSEIGTPNYDAMQAFYLKTGIADSPCEEAPASGILIQSPQGAQRVTLDVNGVQLQLGSTAYIESCPCNGMDVFVVEGSVIVTAAGTSRTVPAGATVHVPTGDDGLANGTPEAVTPYAVEQVQALPISLLGESITIAEPIVLSTGSSSAAPSSPSSPGG